MTGESELNWCWELDQEEELEMMVWEKFHHGGPKGQFQEKIGVQGQRWGVMEG